MIRVRCRSRPVGPASATGAGRRTWIVEPKPAPKPLGRKTSVWLSVLDQWPGTRGNSVGRAPPTGDETVRRRGWAGLAFAPGAGRETATVPPVRGNHVTRRERPTRSHG